MQFSQNSVTVHITANSDVERNAWADHFARLFVGANQVVTAGLWEGIAEPDIQVTTVVFDADYAGFLATVLKELEVYQAGANQQAVLVEGYVLGQRWSALIENPEDYSLVLSRVSGLILDILKERNDRHYDYQAVRNEQRELSDNGWGP